MRIFVPTPSFEATSARDESPGISKTPPKPPIASSCDGWRQPASSARYRSTAAFPAEISTPARAYAPAELRSLTILLRRARAVARTKTQAALLHSPSSSSPRERFTMQIRVAGGAPIDARTSALVVPVFSGEALANAAQLADGAVGGAISEAIASGEFKGSFGDT